MCVCVFVFIYVRMNLLIFMFINIKFKIHMFYKPKYYSKYINHYISLNYVFFFLYKKFKIKKKIILQAEMPEICLV